MDGLEFIHGLAKIARKSQALYDNPFEDFFRAAVVPLQKRKELGIPENDAGLRAWWDQECAILRKNGV